MTGWEGKRYGAGDSKITGEEVKGQRKEKRCEYMMRRAKRETKENKWDEEQRKRKTNCGAKGRFNTPRCASNFGSVLCFTFYMVALISISAGKVIYFNFGLVLFCLVLNALQVNIYRVV